MTATEFVEMTAGLWLDGECRVHGPGHYCSGDDCDPADQACDDDHDTVVSLVHMARSILAERSGRDEGAA